MISGGVASRARDLPLSVKLALPLVCLAILPLAIVTIYNGRVASRELLDSTRQQILRRAGLTARALDRHLEDRLGEVRALGTIHAAEYLTPGMTGVRAQTEVSAQLRRTAQELGLEALFVVDLGGNVIAASEGRFLGRSYRTAPFSLRALAGLSSADEPRYDSHDKATYLHFSAPVRAPDGALIGAAVGRATLTDLDTLVGADADFGGRGDFGVLWDRNGVRLVHGLDSRLRFRPAQRLPADVFRALVEEGRYGPGTGVLLSQATANPEVVERVWGLLFEPRSDPYLSYVSPATGGRVLGALVPLRTMRWAYGVFRPEAAVLADLRAQARRTIPVAAASGGLALLVALALVGYFVGSLRRVGEAARAMAAGDMSRRIDLRHRDEIGQMAAAFDEMASALQEKEEALRLRAAELQVVNEELESFSYSVSHDLRAPLRTIEGFSRIVITEHSQGLDPEAQRLLQRVRAAAQHMAGLIDDLLRLSRISRAEMKLERVDLSRLARKVAAEVRERYPQRRVELSVTEGAVAHADARLMQVLLENLLDNAWKFTSTQPEARVEFGWYDQEGSAVYYVRDNGAGFDMAHADKLFGAFQRLHRQDEFTGTGVGLATVRRIVQRHHGSTWAEGRPAEGATFYFTLGEVV